MKIITEMTTPEMVAEYNQLTGKSIKKFSDRKTGERQLASARQMAETKALLTGIPAKPKAKAVKSKMATKPVKQPKPKSAEVKEGNFKTRITVDGKPYRSVAIAFSELNLPMSKHIKFRSVLKASGKETFEHDGVKYDFVNLPS
jgi:hypothetical protein